MKELLARVYWSFDGTEYDSKEAFTAALNAYAEMLKSPAPPDEKIPLAAISVLVEYVTEDDEDEEIEFVLKADNGEYFTSHELLWKANNKVTKALENQDHHFFEGFRMLREGTPPLYYISLGS